MTDNELIIKTIMKKYEYKEIKKGIYMVEVGDENKKHLYDFYYSTTNEPYKNKNFGIYTLTLIPAGNESEFLKRYSEREIKNMVKEERKTLMSEGLTIWGYYYPIKHERIDYEHMKLFNDFDPFKIKGMVDSKIKINNKVIDIDKKLRPYQIEATKYAVAHKHCIIELPTGRGKTVVALSIIRELTKKNAKKVLVIVPTITLMAQWIADGFDNGGLESSGFYSRNKVLSQYTVITYQSAIRNLTLLPQFEVIIFDEVHHLFAPRNLDILRILFNETKLSQNIIGLTATVRKQGEMGYLVQEEYFPDKFTISLKDFQKSSTGIPTTIKRIGVKLNDENQGLYDYYNGGIMMANAKLGSIVQWPRYVNSSNENIRMLASIAIHHYHKQEAFCNESEEKYKEIYNIVSKTKEQFIIFFDTMRGMYDCALYLEEKKISVDGINSLVDLNDRLEILKEFKNKKLQVLIGGNAITEGLDVPDVSNIILASFYQKSSRKYVQRLGRVLRPKEGKRVNIYLIYAKNTIEEENSKIIYDILGEEINKQR